jgi:hypothetical protein
MMPESTPTCQIHQKYPLILCPHLALPGDPEGLCIIHSQDAAKDHAAFKDAILDIWNKKDSKSHNFRGVFFPGRFDPEDFFGSREFSKAVDFSWATFAAEAIFHEATFTKRADFSEAIFNEEADFYGAAFTKEADFSSASFNEQTRFSSAAFKDRTNFSRTTFKGGADFSSGIFKERPSFSSVTFNEQVSFSRVTFAKGAGFYRALFTGKSDFSRAVFTEDSTFSKATFEGEAKFSNATFNEQANFSRTVFNERVDFSEAYFAGLAFFFWVRFKGEANLSNATIGGRVVFQNINPPDKAGLAPLFIGDFRRLEIQDKGLLNFQDLSLSQARFVATDLRRPEFYNVVWHSYRGRQVLYDEVFLRQRETFFFKIPSNRSQLISATKAAATPPTLDEYGAVERLYRDLQINYESVNDYKSSGDFHYGEMEMHRRASKWRWFPFYWYNIYWLSSGYGERPLRAVLTLVGLLLAFSVFLLGLEKSHVSGGWSWAGFCQSFLYVFQQGTLQKPDWLKPATNVGRLLSAIIAVLIPGQAALFLLALRNRLGRRR